MRIEGYAAHFGKPNLNGEEVVKSSFDKCLETYNALGAYPFINFDHNPTAILGRITEMRTDEVGLYITAEISDAIAEKLGVLRYINNGKVDSFSTEGYIDDISVNADEKYYTAGDFYITAVAVVPMPADPDATFKKNNLRKSFIGYELPTKEGEKKNKKQNNNQIIFLL